MQWPTMLLTLFLLVGSGEVVSGDQDWELSGVWKLDSDIKCTSAFLEDTRLDAAEVSLADDLGTFILE